MLDITVVGRYTNSHPTLPDVVPQELQPSGILFPLSAAMLRNSKSRAYPGTPHTQTAKTTWIQVYVDED